MVMCNPFARLPESVSMLGNPEDSSSFSSSSAPVASETEYLTLNSNCSTSEKHSRSRRRDDKLRRCSFHSELLAPLLVLAFLSHVCSAFGGSTNAAYTDGQEVIVWAVKIGPYASPVESYGFFDKLSWCQPTQLEHRPRRLGETLAGDSPVKSAYKLSFREENNGLLLCEKSLSVDDVNSFIRAIQKRYVYELLMDELPMKLLVGYEGEEESAGHNFLYTHIDFLVHVNGGYIIKASAEPDKPIELSEGSAANLRFTYSVKWEDTDFPYERRAEKYLDPHHKRDLEIHWYSIVNAILSVFLLMGLLGSILLRVINRDFREYEALETADDRDDYGWKLLYGDVFRFPPGLTLLCPCLGTGVQLLILSTIMLIFGIGEFFHPLSRGTVYTVGVLSYSVTAGVAGFVSGYLYKQMGGGAWMRNALVTVFLFCGPAALIWVFLNGIAMLYGSTRALPLWTILAIGILWAVVTIPLTVVGAIVGKNCSRPFDAPSRTAKIPREIPACAWYRRPISVAMLCGLMPFSSIYVEIYFLFGAVWGHKIFQVYEMLAIVFVILVMVTTITTASAVYFQLVEENHKWAWASVGYGGSIGLYIMIYSCYYYLVSSPLHGLMQTCYFFGYMLLVSYAFFLMCGTVGFFAARRFVRFLYASVKND